MRRLLARLRGLLTPGAVLREAFAAAEAGRLQDVFPVISAAAQKGDRRAQYWVGKGYLEGRGVPHSRVTATQWLTRAAEGGQREAQSVLAALYLTGASKAEGRLGGASVFADDGATEPDFGQAARWARPAAEGGSADAQALLAYLMTSGPEEMRDLPAAMDWYRKSAEAGCAQGSLGLALAILRDAKDDADRAKAAAEMAKAAALGSAAGRIPVGHHDRGRGGRAARHGDGGPVV